MQMLVCLMLSQRSLEVCFSLCYSDSVISILSSGLLMPSVSPNLLLIPSSVFFISVIVLVSSDQFFLFSSSLLKFSLCSSTEVKISFLLQLLWTLYYRNYLCFINFFSPKGFFLVLLETYPSVFSFELFCLYKIS